MKRVCLNLFTVLVTAVSMEAATITFSSQGTAADPNESNNFGPTVAIVPNPAWAAPLPGSNWVSFAATGSTAIVFVNVQNGVLAQFSETLFLPWVPTSGTVTYRGDDSAALYINGQLVAPEAPTAGNTYTRCSDFAPGCLEDRSMTVNIASYLTSGQNTIRFDVTQRNGNSFGVNYAGSITGTPSEPDTSTPEPASLALVGGVLVAAGLVRRHKKA